MNAYDLFGRVSSDEEDDVEEKKPTTIAETLLMDLEFRTDDETINQQPHPDTQSSCSPVEQTYQHNMGLSPEKFYLPNNEDSQEDMDFDAKRKKVLASGVTIKPDTDYSMHNQSSSEKPYTAQWGREESPNCSEPPCKKPKSDTLWEAFDEWKRNRKPKSPMKIHRNFMARQTSLMSEKEKILVKLEKKDHKTVEQSEKELFDHYCSFKPTKPTTEEEEIYAVKQQILLANMSKEQYDRYLVYRRSHFTKTSMKSLLDKFTKNAKIDPKVVPVICGLMKVVVGEIVEEALDIRDGTDQKDERLQPHHIRQAYLSLREKGDILKLMF